MKHIYQLWGICLVAFPILAGCEKDLPVYNYSECGLKFSYTQDRDSVYNYSFAFATSELNLQEDTVKVKVALVGDVADYDRPISLQQIPSGAKDAVAGTHYVPFDDPSLASLYVLPKNAISTIIPIVVKRDASLKTDDYKLKFTFKTNDNFSFTLKERGAYSVVIADQLIKPNNWDNYCEHFFGSYSKVKHQLLIDATGFKWDNDFVDNRVKYYMGKDQNVVTGWQKKAQLALDEYQAEHGEPLRDENGDIVTMGF